jgi:hypothetical protein
MDYIARRHLTIVPVAAFDLAVICEAASTGGQCHSVVKSGRLSADLRLH